MIATYESKLSDPTLQQIVRAFFDCEHHEEYFECYLRQNPANISNPFQFGPMLICEKRVFFLLIDAHLIAWEVVISDFRTAFPAYKDYELNPILISKSIRPDQVKYLTNQGIYAMALGEENMELLNFDELQGR